MKRLLKWLLSAFRPAPLPPPREPTPIVDEIDILLRDVRLAQEKAEIENAAKRHAERMAKIAAWSAPEAIEERRIAHEAAAAAALEKAQAMSRHAREALGMPYEDPPLPPRDQIPEKIYATDGSEMRTKGQSDSTLRAMLRQANWSYDGCGWHPPKPKFAVVEGPIERCWRLEMAPAALKDDDE